MTTDNKKAQQEEKTAQQAGEQTNNVTAEFHQTKDTEELSDSDKLAEAQEEIAQLKDKYLRQVAEFDNYRKRTIKEKSELILNGGAKVIEALLPVLDDLERAVANIEKSNDISTLKEGVDLIITKLGKALNGQGLKKIEAVGKVFDTDYHEAVALIPATEETQKNRVIDCVQTGYLLNDKVLRHAKVVVGQ